MTLDGPDGERRRDHRARRDASEAGALAAGEYAPRSTPPASAAPAGPCLTVGAGASRLDLVLAPAPVSERVVVSATRGEATLSSLGVTADVLDRADDRRPRGALAPAPAAGGAGRRHRARRPDRSPGLRLRPRRRVALRARARGRRAREPAGRGLRLRHRRALRARADRGRARGGEQPLRHGRPGRRREPRRRGGRGRARARRCAPRARAAPSTGSASSARPRGRAAASTGTRARSASTTDNEEPNSRFEQTAAALSAGREDRRADGGAGGRPLRRQHDGNAGPDRVRPARPRRVLRARRTSWSPRPSAVARPAPRPASRSS